MSAVGCDAKHVCVCVAFNLKRSCYACSSLFLSYFVHVPMLSLPCTWLLPASCPLQRTGMRVPFPVLVWIFLAVYIDLDLFSVDCIGNTFLSFFSSPRPLP